MEDYQAMMKKNYKFSQKRKIQDTFMDPNMVHTNVNGMLLWLIGDETSLVDRLVRDYYMTIFISYPVLT